MEKKYNLQEQLFPNELEVLRQMKSMYDICNNFSDEFVMASLFYSKLDLVRTHRMLQSHWKWRQDSKLVEIPRFSELNKELLDYFILSFGSRCKNGSVPVINNLSKVVPNQPPYVVPEMAKLFLWFFSVGIFSQGIDVFRNGYTLIIDAKDFGWKSIDIDYHRQLANMFSNNFPQRMRACLVYNSPPAAAAMIKVFKTFMKAKLMNRVCLIELKELQKYVNQDNLFESVGGSYPMNYDRQLEKYKEWVELNEERLIAPSRKH